MQRTFVLISCLGLTACSWMGRQADALGEHMPVIGERCEHWQCVTTHGQERSDEIKAEREQQEQQAQEEPDAPEAASPDSATAPAHK